MASVFMSVYNMKFTFGHPVHFEWIRVKFVYEGHRVKVKVKVTAAKIVGNEFPYSGSVKLYSAINPVL